MLGVFSHLQGLLASLSGLSGTIWDYLGKRLCLVCVCVSVFALFVPCLQRDLCWISSYYAVQKCPKALQVRALQVHLVI